MTTPSDGDDSPPLPANLRFLKGLVTVLTAVMILGVITIVALLVIRLNTAPAPLVLDPGAYALPGGVTAVGLSVIEGRAVIVGDDGVIRVYDRAGGAALQEFEIGG
jgi:uncharacterized integral membrane protein